MTAEDRTEPVDITSPLIAIFGEAEPGTIYSQPEKVGDSVIITASAWERAGGFGTGSGYGTADGEPGGGQGGGGGGASQGRPVAVIRVTGATVEVKPVIDFTKVGITALFALVGWLSARRRASS